MRICTKCKLSKSINQFYSDKRKKDGYMIICSACALTYQRNYYKQGRQRPFPVLKNRFYSKTLLPNENGCMLWVGNLNAYGYGDINFKKKNLKAHRVSYQLHYGEIPKGMLICHKCDVRNCVSPNHLFLGTAKDNTKDMICKNRHSMKKGEIYKYAYQKTGAIHPRLKFK